MEKTGVRHNEGKLRWRNVPMFLMRGLVEVGAMGEDEYGTYNYLKGLSVSDTLDSAFRHLDAATDPMQSDFDTKSKLHHLKHAAWNALVAAWMIENRPDLDDRLTLEQLNLVEKVEGKISNISAAAHGRKKTAYGFLWEI